MNIFKTIVESIYNPEFYASQKDAPASKPWKYAALILGFTSLAGTIVFVYTFIFPGLKLLSPAGVDDIAKTYPAELVVTIKNGMASSNVKEPYAIDIPKSWSSMETPSSTIQHLIVLDTATTTAMSSFDSYKSFAVVTKDTLISRKNHSGTLEINRFPRDMNEVITRDTISTWLTQLAKILKGAMPFLVLGILIGHYVLSFIATIVIVALCALIVFIVEKVRGRAISYGQTFLLGFYAFTAAEIIGMLFKVANLPLPWYVYFAILLVSYLINLTAIPAENKNSSQV